LKIVQKTTEGRVKMSADVASLKTSNESNDLLALLSIKSNMI